MQTVAHSNTTYPYLPPEWAPQAAIMLTWPHAYSDWHTMLPAVERVFTEIARLITQYEALIVVCYDTAHQQHIQSILNIKSQNYPVSYYHAHSNECWARDHGPLSVFIGENKCQCLDFQFNAWGDKFPSALDNHINHQLHMLDAWPDHTYQSLDFVLEGGAIDVNGEGGLLTTRSCLLANNRNPHLSAIEIEQLLMRTLGIHTIHWLSEGCLNGDDTDGHIDMLARFCDPMTIGYTHCDDASDPHYIPLQRMATELNNFKSQQGSPYQLIALPLPTPQFNSQGQRLPASYANFLIINQAVLVPIYGVPTDGAALDLIQCCFPDRMIHPVLCNPLIQQGGALHCVTMQIPKKRV